MRDPGQSGTAGLCRHPCHRYGHYRHFKPQSSIPIPVRASVVTPIRTQCDAVTCRQKDVGRPKAIAAAEFIMRRVPGCTVTPYYGKIQDKDDDYYMQFNIVICGLDSVEARRWMNATLVRLVDPEVEESLKPLIDGGTEGMSHFLKLLARADLVKETGFKGQARVILPTITACYECSLDLHTPQTTYPLCTIQNTPRLPEHCISWASVLEWPRVFKDKKMDTDDPDHIGWLYDQASRRAKEFKIEGVTWSLTQGVVKNIVRCFGELDTGSS